MSLYNMIDKSDTKLLSNLFVCAQILSKKSRLSVELLAQTFLECRWFALLLKNENLMNFLQYSIENREVAAMKALLSAFTYPTTRQGILALCKALFGEDSQTNLIEERGLIHLEISNANGSFVWGFETIGKDPQAVVDSQNRWITFRIFSILGDNNLESFFWQFVPVGVVCTVKLLNPENP